MAQKISKKVEKEIFNLAKTHCIGLRNRNDLKTKRNDNDDFIEFAVWELEETLIAVYNLGKNEVNKEKK